MRYIDRVIIPIPSHAVRMEDYFALYPKIPVDLGTRQALTQSTTSTSCEMNGIIAERLRHARRVYFDSPIFIYLIEGNAE